ncbi:MAG: fumarylacetoacetate hydrolase family protein [Rhodospirillaceae bacterium]|jgi:2,4-didehydro-3-deoxy-L-rhamnonate hydrolase|nr:fumarylacetoacetate hydrolase family protein [Rhodospirillaceae bacterium]MBT5244315.1 fumarylacetoacetate hydrolase family protein [Rhodospirillaceae bacterium]MBT5563676.1 fumarylacetoacetate hydrolase family protein [Rhodospirillaceae bacterium]MBT6241506.1 fumarylacetoacetate hydrolase family protein [Rhodospirillaceae bacterium]MBT7137078.1 fumarylacetoacetate hydrolase family protein [Rhodospirillaceae bacterium]
MKLLRYGPDGQEKPGLIDEQGRIRDLSSLINDIDPDTLSPERLAQLSVHEPSSLPIVDAPSRFGPPVSGVGKILAIGLNYADHAAETKLDLPPEPLVFAKAITCLAGPNDPLTLPKDSQCTDYEVELAAIIGTRAQYVSESKALEHVAGYAVMNDYSERDFQIEHGGQWIKGKSFDGFGPLGPWLVTADEIPNPQNLKIWCDVNGERRQNSNTQYMVFGVAQIISNLSQFMTLMPGDVISTGTPPGVGMGHKPPLYLKAGDVVELGVEGLGQQRQQLENWPK